MSSYPQQHLNLSRQEEFKDETEKCAICLSETKDRTIIAPCYHSQYCFRCILVWSQKSRKCPLCLGPIDHFLHHLSPNADYERYYPLPLLQPEKPQPSTSTHHLHQPSLPSRSVSDSKIREIQETKHALISLDRRKFIYRHGLYAKHIGANEFTCFRPICPSSFTRHFAEHKTRVTTFLRRELAVFEHLEGQIEARIRYILQILLSLDCKSDSAIRLFTHYIAPNKKAIQLIHQLQSIHHDLLQSARNASDERLIPPPANRSDQTLAIHTSRLHIRFIIIAHRTTLSISTRHHLTSLSLSQKATKIKLPYIEPRTSLIRSKPKCSIEIYLSAQLTLQARRTHNIHCINYWYLLASIIFDTSAHSFSFSSTNSMSYLL
ncbi:uncharacterized protein MELLADRAFT_95890 [Melampsora larici-populina 98AG31]|uniref:RING-type E3 ubiquitin transferase n=1 Tax=Melampsora larici-populina (strain 98AG31 / pathotype 3-4-7) TaxID=747676 RepID=F4RDM9_MELLP|nr:uncharacterized protein MELLADRAFT_95890 [Melampsora larici-populina 98AG31]EGG09428.1 hypothetical protein MELLADRAFT_95890 [Melampsora larici-populina 98AG31]